MSQSFFFFFSFFNMSDVDPLILGNTYLNKCRLQCDVCHVNINLEILSNTHLAEILEDMRTLLPSELNKFSKIHAFFFFFFFWNRTHEITTNSLFY